MADQFAIIDVVFWSRAEDGKREETRSSRLCEILRVRRRPLIANAYATFCFPSFGQLYYYHCWYLFMNARLQKIQNIIKSIFINIVLTLLSWGFCYHINFINIILISICARWVIRKMHLSRNGQSWITAFTFWRKVRLIHRLLRTTMASLGSISPVYISPITFLTKQHKSFLQPLLYLQSINTKRLMNEDSGRIFSLHYLPKKSFSETNVL